jgi:hypothetical protein
MVLPGRLPQRYPNHLKWEAIWGIVIGQAILYGPSLIGKKILLPLDLLAVPGSYLPLTEQYKDIVPHNVTQSDLIFGLEPAREGFNNEVRAGRAPLWSPYVFAGTPAFRVGLSPPWLLAYLIESPVVLAPPAWFSFKRRSVVAMLTLLTFISLSWALHVPLIVPLLRLPVLNMMSHNRMAFVAALTLIALGSIGLEVLLRREVHRRWWFGMLAILLAVLFSRLSMCTPNT